MHSQEKNQDTPQAPTMGNLSNQQNQTQKRTQFLGPLWSIPKSQTKKRILTLDLVAQHFQIPFTFSLPKIIQEKQKGATFIPTQKNCLIDQCNTQTTSNKEKTNRNNNLTLEQWRMISSIHHKIHQCLCIENLCSITSEVLKFPPKVVHTQNLFPRLFLT